MSEKQRFILAGVLSWGLPMLALLTLFTAYETSWAEALSARRLLVELVVWTVGGALMGRWKYHTHQQQMADRAAYEADDDA